MTLLYIIQLVLVLDSDWLRAFYSHAIF